MTAALGLAARGVGRTWPNPAVGCVLVRPDRDGGRVVGRGWTAPGGRPHAETEALAQAGRLARNATAYVTLEPCAHHGQTPPCAQALIAAGVKRVVVAIEDPDPRVSGAGVAMLRQAGIEVSVGEGAARAKEITAGFLKRVRDGRPLVTLKTATTLDGRIATGTGHSKWITGEQARAYGHLLRAQHDGVMTGAGTVAADDPRLNCRLAGLEDRSPVRIIADGRLRTDPDASMIADARQIPTWILTLEDVDPDRRVALERRGAVILTVGAGSDGRPDLTESLSALGNKGMTRLMVECGGMLAAALFRARLVDRIAWFRSGHVFGGDGAAMARAFGVADIADAPIFERMEIVELGNDLLETYAVRA